MTDQAPETTPTAIVPAKEPTPVVTLNITVDRAKVTLGDMRFMIKTRSKEKGQTTIEEAERIFDFLERVVVGGIEDIPFDALEQVMEAVFTQINPEADIKN